MIQYVKMQTASCAVLRPNLNSSDSLSLPGDLEISLVRFTNNVHYYSYFHYLKFVLFTHELSKKLQTTAENADQLKSRLKRITR